MKQEKKLFFIFQMVVAIISFVAIIFLVIDFINVLPQCRAYKYSIDDVQIVLYKTSVGKIVNYMTTTDTTNFVKLATNALLTFFRYLNPVCILFILIIALICFIYAIYDKKTSKAYTSYLPFIAIISLIFIGKYLVSAGIFGLFYDESMISIGTSLTIMAYFQLLCNIALIAGLLLFIIKFIISLIYLFKTQESHQ